VVESKCTGQAVKRYVSAVRRRQGQVTHPLVPKAVDGYISSAIPTVLAGCNEGVNGNEYGDKCE